MPESAAAPQAPAPSLADSPRAEALRRRLRGSWALRGFMLGKLPLALVAGVRMPEITAGRCVATVPYGWRSTNPFRSTYFAALAMAAELSTGALAMVAVQAAPQPVSMLITGMEAAFEKKATATTAFTCDDGAALAGAVARTLATGEPVTLAARTVGRMPDGTVVARFAFTWSFRRR